MPYRVNGKPVNRRPSTTTLIGHDDLIPESDHSHPRSKPSWNPLGTRRSGSLGVGRDLLPPRTQQAGCRAGVVLPSIVPVERDRARQRCWGLWDTLKRTRGDGEPGEVGVWVFNRVQ